MNPASSSKKSLGFLSFGHWSPTHGSRVRNAAEALAQAIELTVAAEEIGLEGAYFRVHHFAPQHSSPFPLLAAAGAKTSKIALGTAVIDMRYENPFHMAETAAVADLIAGGRLELGISRGIPEPMMALWHASEPIGDPHKSDIDLARERAQRLLDLVSGSEFSPPASSHPLAPRHALRVEPQSPGLRERIWWGSASIATARWAAAMGMNLQSSTLKEDEGGKPFHVQQREQIEAYRDAWKAAGHARAPRVSVTRSIFALVNDRDVAYFGRDRNAGDHFGWFDEQTRLVFGRGYAAEPDVLARLLAQDEAIAAADTLLLTIPNQLGVDYNVHLLGSILQHVAPQLGW